MVGSGSLYGGCVLTTAHNIFDGKTGELYHDRMAYRAKKGTEAYQAEFQLSKNKVAFHQDYDGTPWGGHDIAMIKIEKNIGGKNGHKYFYGIGHMEYDYIWKPYTASKLSVGMKIQVIGYPGEKGGYLYQHTGQLLEIETTSTGGVALWYDLDTTPGQSGSPVYLILEKPEGKVIKHRIGIHQGWNIERRQNCGTLLTPPIMKWINEQDDKLTKK